MPTKLTYTGAEVQGLLDKIEKGDFDNAKTLEGHPASYFAIASEFTSLAESFATEQGRVNTLYSYFNNGSANDALSLGGKLPSYYATATQYEILQRALSDFKSLFDSMFEKDSDGNIHAKLSLWSSGGITAGGVGSGGSGGGGISYNRLDSWSDYSADKAGYVLSALLGKDLDNRVSALANAGYITQSALAPYALRSEIPSLVGYATESFVTSQGYITASALGGYATQNWVEDSYLSKNGGTMTDALTVKGSGSPLTVHCTQPLASVVKFVNTDGNLGWLGVDIDKTAIFMEASGVIKKLLHSGNYSSYALPITGGTIYGGIGALKIKRSGTGNSYIEYQNNTETLGYIGFRAKGAPAYMDDTTYIQYDLLHLYNYRDYVVATNGNSTINGSLTATSFTGNLVGNADSATKLATPRTIWGQSFDGTENITHGFRSLYAYSYNGGVAHSILNNQGSPYGLLTRIFGNGSVSLQAQREANDAECFNLLLNHLGGNVAIGSTTADEKLHVHGNGKFTGSVTASSLTIGGTSTISGGLKGLQNLIFADGYLGRKFSLTNSGGIFYQAPSGSVGWATNWSVKSNDGITSFGDLGGAFGVGNSLSYFYYGGEYNAPSIAIMPSGMIAIGGTTADEKLHVHGNGKFTGALTANSLTIGGATITYDSANEALCINGNMYALGGITAGGAGISAYASLEARVARLEQQLNI